MNIERLERDRKALAGLHGRLNDVSQDEYNALVHAIWRIDAILRDEREKTNA